VTEQVIAITRCVSWALMPQKYCPGPRWGSLQHSPDPLAGFEGVTSPAYAY